MLAGIRESVRRMRRCRTNGPRNGSREQHSLQLRTGRMQLCRAIRAWWVLLALVHVVVPVAKISTCSGCVEFSVRGVSKLPNRSHSSARSEKIRQPLTGSALLGVPAYRGDRTSPRSQM